MRTSQNIVLTPSPSRPQPVFPLSIAGVNGHLPTQLGGLQSSVVFIEEGNTFRLYQIAQLAQIHHLNPKKVLDNIYISRAFITYQTAALIKNQLTEAIKKYKAKLVIISDIAGFFLDRDISEVETQRIYSHVVTYLSNFARDSQTIVIATYPPHLESSRNDLLHKQTCAKANVVLSINRTDYARKIALEKHPYLPFGSAEFPNEGLTIDDFAETKHNWKSG